MFTSPPGRVIASALRDLSLTFTVQYGRIPELTDLQIRPAATGLNHSHRETDLNGTSRSDQHLLGEEPASESENLNLSKASVDPGFFFPIFFQIYQGIHP